MDQKVKQQGFIRALWILHTPKILRYGHLLRPESESGPRRPDMEPDPDPTNKARIRIRNTAKGNKELMKINMERQANLSNEKLKISALNKKVHNTTGVAVL
jgi:hypothetical protein